MTPIALALIAIGLIQLHGKPLALVTVAALLILVCAAAVALVDQAGW